MSKNKALASFEAAETDDQIELIESLFDSLDDMVAVRLCHDGVDRASDEYLRARIFDSLYSGVDIGRFYSEFCSIVKEVLSRNDDELVRQYAAKAAWRFCNDNALVSILEGIVANTNQDIDVRHNAFTALERNKHLPNVQFALERLVEVEEFARFAKAALNR